MGKADYICSNKDHGIKKKTPNQIQCLEKFYAEDKYPKQNKIEEYAALLNLSYKQVRIWFSERRRKGRKENEVQNSSGKSSQGSNNAQGCKTRTDERTNGPIERKGTHKVVKRTMTSNSEKSHLLCLQVLLSKDHILRRVFRKDGPALGGEFDPLPNNAFGFSTESTDLQPCGGNPRATKRRKVVESSVLKSKDLDARSGSPRKYGMGKGLMTIWRTTHPGKRFPTDISSTVRNDVGLPVSSDGSFQSQLLQVSAKSQLKGPVQKANVSRKGLQDKRSSAKKRKVLSNKVIHPEKLFLKECKLACQETSEQSIDLAMLVDDEELELRELEVGPNPLRCSAHLSSNGRNVCPFCKDLLARFPPQLVKMRQLFCTRPWDSSPELVKKLFKVLQFLHAYPMAVEVCPFTVDEFAQAFHDKDSLLLGKVHLGLLKQLLLVVENGINAGFIARASKDSRFLRFVHFIREHELDANFWKQSLNPLTWTEILRQVLVAAGFSSKLNASFGGNFNKERNQMIKYGLRSRTLKGELFSVLSRQGTCGLKVSEMARTSQVVDLSLSSSGEELEELITTTLSSDITLFEKIGLSAYRLRVDPNIKGKGDSQSDTDDSGSVDDDSDDASMGSGDDSDECDEMDSAIGNQRIVKYRAQHKKSSQKITNHIEIDESYSGDAFVLGLMEGEYSNLSIEEKLDILVALVDLASSCFSSKLQEPGSAISAIPRPKSLGSGAKVKKSLTTNQLNFTGLLSNELAPEARFAFSDTCQTDPSAILSHAFNDLKALNNGDQCHSGASGDSGSRTEVGQSAHMMQLVYLGSDRRYNNYWLFLGACTVNDPGHRRVYFESSEDGHWEVIDTAQSLRSLISILDTRGIREARLFGSLEKREVFLCQAMDDYVAVEPGSEQTKSCGPSDSEGSSGRGSSPISDVDNVHSQSDNLLAASGAIILQLGRNSEEKKKKWEQSQAFDKWIWHSFYSNLNVVKCSKWSYMESLARCESCHDLYWRDEKHCKTCHTTFEIDFDLEEKYAIHVATCKEAEENSEYPRHKVLSSQLQALKAAIYAIEAGMPEVALAASWTRSVHKLWVKRLRRTSSLPELLQVLTDFVGALNEAWLCECTAKYSNMASDEIIVYFQTMPQTISALALWMVKLDSLIAPHMEKMLSERTPMICMSERKGKRACAT